MADINIKKQPPEVFYKKRVLKNFTTFTLKHLSWDLVLIKLQPFRPVNIANFLRTPILKNICERLLLNISTKIGKNTAI